MAPREYETELNEIRDAHIFDKAVEYIMMAYLHAFKITRLQAP